MVFRRVRNLRFSLNFFLCHWGLFNIQKDINNIHVYTKYKGTNIQSYIIIISRVIIQIKAYIYKVITYVFMNNLSKVFWLAIIILKWKNEDFFCCYFTILVFTRESFNKKNYSHQFLHPFLYSAFLLFSFAFKLLF